MNDFQPTRTQFATARDAAALARLIISGDETAATEMLGALMRDPAAIPGVMSGMCFMIGQALMVPEHTDPPVFFEAVTEMLGDVEQRSQE